MIRFMNLFHFLAVWFGVIAILSISPVSAAEKPEVFCMSRYKLSGGVL